jgi:hypothetical protein
MWRVDEGLYFADIKSQQSFYVFLESKMSSYSHGFATALFSFLYHLASYEAGNLPNEQLSAFPLEVKSC